MTISVLPLQNNNALSINLRPNIKQHKGSVAINCSIRCWLHNHLITAPTSSINPSGLQGIPVEYILHRLYLQTMILEEGFQHVAPATLAVLSDVGL